VAIASSICCVLMLHASSLWQASQKVPMPRQHPSRESRS